MMSCQKAEEITINSLFRLSGASHKSKLIYLFWYTHFLHWRLKKIKNIPEIPRWSEVDYAG